MALTFSSNCYVWWSPAVLGVVWHMPAHGKRWNHSSFCFALYSWLLLSPLNCLCLNPWVSSFYLSDSLPSPTGGWASEWLGGVWCLAGVKPWQLSTTVLASRVPLSQVTPLQDVQRDLSCLACSVPPLTNMEGDAPRFACAGRGEEEDWDLQALCRG